MPVRPAGIARTYGFWASIFNRMQVTDGIASAEKAPVVEVFPDAAKSTVFFDHNEANIHIRTVRLFAGTDLIAENTIDIQKTNRQSLTITRRDILRGL